MRDDSSTYNKIGRLRTMPPHLPLPELVPIVWTIALKVRLRRVDWIGVLGILGFIGGIYFLSFLGRELFATQDLSLEY